MSQAWAESTERAETAAQQHAAMAATAVEYRAKINRYSSLFADHRQKADVPPAQLRYSTTVIRKNGRWVVDPWLTDRIDSCLRRASETASEASRKMFGGRALRE